MSDETGRVRRILEATYARTRSGIIVWKESMQREHGFEATVGDGTLFCGTADDDGVAPYEFVILGENGVEAGRIEGPGGVSGVDVRALYRLIEDRVYGIDDVLNDVEKGLGLD